MSGQRKWFAFFTLGIFLNVVYFNFVQAGTLPPGWKTECVGYYQLNLPAEVEADLSNYSISANEQRSKFYTDGIGMFSADLYIDGRFSVADARYPGAFEEVITSAKENMVKEKEALLAEGKRNTANRIQFYPDLMPKTVRIDDSWGAYVYFQRGEHIYVHAIGNPYTKTAQTLEKPISQEQTEELNVLSEKPISVEETKELNGLVDQFLKRFKARVLFEIPSETGLCIPFGFIADEDKNKGKKGRNVVVNFRLRNHPEIEIYFSDQTVGMPPGYRRGDIDLDVRRKLKEFWKDHSDKKLKHEDGFEDGFRAVKLAGREGLATFFEIIRDDNSVDYAYAAYVKGDQAAGNPTPNLMLSVIRKAAYAHMRGAAPMNKKNLLKLAERIVASVHLRNSVKAFAQAAVQQSAHSAVELRNAINPDYKTPAGMRQECIGRLLFDVAGELEWGVTQGQKRDSVFIGFSDHRIHSDLHDGQEIVVSGVSITVRGPVPRTVIQRMVNSHKIAKREAIFNMTHKKKEMEQRRAQLQNMITEIKKKNDIREIKFYDQLQEAIGNFSTEIRSLEKRISAFIKDTQPFKLGLPDSAGYRWGSALMGYRWSGYLWRDQFLYFFSSSGDEPLFEQPKTDFDRVIKHFRPRQRYKMPTERGICFPHGFIQDEGVEGFRVKNIMRFTDQPDVIYSFLTHPFDANTSDEIKRSRTPGEPDHFFMYDGDGNKSFRVGPRHAKIGAFQAQQSGVFLLSTRDKVETYNLNTGYTGYRGSQVLPTIGVDMAISIPVEPPPLTESYKPTLKEDTAPLSDRLKRLDGLLQSIRLRPTEPPMPELVPAP